MQGFWNIFWRVVEFFDNTSLAQALRWLGMATCALLGIAMFCVAFRLVTYSVCYVIGAIGCALYGWDVPSFVPFC